MSEVWKSGKKQPSPDCNVLSEIFGKYLMRWRLTPVSSREIHDYVGNLHLLPVTDDNITFAEWSGTWESDTTDAVEYMNGVYRSLLRDLAAAFGAKR